MLNLMYNCEIRKATVCYVHYLRSAWDLLKFSNNIGKWLWCKIPIQNKTYRFLVILLKSKLSSEVVIIYKGVQNSFNTSTFYSSQGPCSWCIPFKGVSVGRQSLVSTIKTIASLIKYILTIVSCIWQLHHSQYRLQKLSHSKYIQLKFQKSW